MTFDIDDVIKKANELKVTKDYDMSDSRFVTYEDAITYVEDLVNTIGNGKLEDVHMVSGQSWEDVRLNIALNPRYTDRCRNHPYFQDLIGRQLDGKVFE